MIQSQLALLVLRVLVSTSCRAIVATLLALHSRFSIIWYVSLELTRYILFDSSVRRFETHDRTRLCELLCEENKSLWPFPLHALSQLR